MRLTSLFDDQPAGLRGKAVALYALLIAANLVAWVWAVAAFRDDVVLDHLTLAREELGDGPPETRIRDPMGTVGRHRQIAALDLVRPLRAGLDTL